MDLLSRTVLISRLITLHCWLMGQIAAGGKNEELCTRAWHQFAISRDAPSPGERSFTAWAAVTRLACRMIYGFPLSVSSDAKHWLSVKLKTMWLGSLNHQFVVCFLEPARKLYVSTILGKRSSRTFDHHCILLMTKSFRIRGSSSPQPPHVDS